MPCLMHARGNNSVKSRLDTGFCRKMFSIVIAEYHDDSVNATQTDVSSSLLSMRHQEAFLERPGMLDCTNEVLVEPSKFNSAPSAPT